jgi:DNA-binding transcriptional LysR family regulator
MQQLETELGGPMFIRHGRRLALTELGASVHSHADAISAHVGAIGEEAAELAAAARGTVRIGGVEPLAHLDLVPLLARLGRERPHIRLRIDVGSTALLATSVADGRLAFAVCSAPPPELELVFEPLFREPIGLCSPIATRWPGTTEPSRYRAWPPSGSSSASPAAPIAAKSSTHLVAAVWT